MPPAGRLGAVPASVGAPSLGEQAQANINGLNVAFLDGTYNHPIFTGSKQASSQSGSCPYYTKEDVEWLKAQLQALQGEVDVLLTCEWPRGITTGIEGPLPLPQNFRPDASGSDVVSELVDLARPRYHIAGGEVIHYTRPPFFHRDLGAGIRVTRFVGLAPQGHPSKAKALHALSLVPAANMEPEALSVVPEGCTPSPFELRKAKQDQEEMAPPAAIAGPRKPLRAVQAVVVKASPWRDAGSVWAPRRRTRSWWRALGRRCTWQWTRVLL
ncbi:hypothetical protein Vretifemale_11824 [Volvox reticuliferus]|uniref:Uncharacterized protein n=1 Tax=Volvox reticuliferus TaxID=1737510 RepID=A0A8J4CH31_9CHLO|nr:hypothetical protein Vretifemale_11824 [Volvox reticuliferus]